MKHRAWAAFYTFSAGQALGIFDDLPIPGMYANIDPNWTIEGANPTLDTFIHFRYDMTGYHRANAVGFIAQRRGHIPIRRETYLNIPLDNRKVQ